MMVHCSRCGRDAEMLDERQPSLPKGWTGSVVAEIPMLPIVCPSCAADGEGDDAALVGVPTMREARLRRDWLDWRARPGKDDPSR